MANNLPKGAKVFNVIRANSSEVFVNTVPSATKDNIQMIKNILFNDAYQPMLNEFVTNLINRIGLTIIRNKSFDNPLAIFKKGSVPLGTDIQDIYENPAVAEQYEYSNTAMAKLLTITDPDTHVAYYRRNRQDLYTKTIAREGLQGAFVSWEEFENYIAGITNSLYSGNYIDEFKYTKQLIDGAYDNGKVIQKVVTNPTTDATSKAFLKEVRALYDLMSFPSTEYNAYTKFSGAKGEITTWTDKDRVCLIVRADVMANVDVDALASAFNIDRADFLGRIVKVDKFENDEILGVVCDESWLQIYDNIFRFDEFYNARTMSWNEYLHAWGTYAICPFANAVMLVTSASKPVTAIAGSDQTVVADANKTVTFTFTPADATSETTFTSSDETVFTVEPDDNYANKCTITGVDAGTADLTITADNGVYKTVEVTVTAE
ncbi:MAG: hypothetical protein VZR33_05765 [Methanosphaera sp.]|nr:hypothetical protein [Methanosphaera sp.]